MNYWCPHSVDILLTLSKRQNLSVMQDLLRDPPDLAQIKEQMLDMFDTQRAHFQAVNLVNLNGEEVRSGEDIYADRTYSFIEPIVIVNTSDLGEDVDPHQNALDQVRANLQSSKMQHGALLSELNELQHNQTPNMDAWINQFESFKRNKTKDDWTPGVDDEHAEPVVAGKRQNQVKKGQNQNNNYGDLQSSDRKPGPQNANDMKEAILLENEHVKKITR